MNVKEYISGGIIESYVMGLATEAERHEFESMCAQYPEVLQARDAFEKALEKQLLQDAVAPPQFLQQQVINKITASAVETHSVDLGFEATPVKKINVWRWVAAASLILLAGSVYWTITTNKKYQGLQAKNQELENQLQQSTVQVNQVQEDMDKLQHPMKTAALKSEDNRRTFATIYWDTLSPSKDVYLLINNLPQPTSDKQYQLWALLNGKPIDLGMIEAKQKRLLYRMKNVQDAQAFAITLEPKGGSPSPTSAPISVSKL